MPVKPVTVEVPGRACLLGDKIDLIGYPVIAAAVDLMLTLELVPRDDRVFACYSEDLDELVMTDMIGDLPLSGPLRYITAALGLLRHRLSHQVFSVRIHSDLPIGAGLSSSAAITVAFTRALNHAFGLHMTLADIAETAYVAEHDILGINCGRMDQYAIAYGGITFINTSAPASVERIYRRELALVVGDTQEHRQAANMLAHVRAHLDAKDPLFVDAFERVRDLTLAGKEALAAGNDALAGELMNANMELEIRMGCSWPRMEKLCQVSRAAGAWGAKRMGAGGGGSMVALGPGRQQEVAAAIKAAGGRAFTCNVFRYP